MTHLHFVIDSSFLLIELHYDSFPMTHSFSHFVYKPLAPSMYSLSYSYSDDTLLLPRLGLHPT